MYKQLNRILSGIVSSDGVYDRDESMLAMALLHGVMQSAADLSMFRCSDEAFPGSAVLHASDGAFLRLVLSRRGVATTEQASGAQTGSGSGFEIAGRNLVEFMLRHADKGDVSAVLSRAERSYKPVFVVPGVLFVPASSAAEASAIGSEFLGDSPMPILGGAVDDGRETKLYTTRNYRNIDYSPVCFCEGATRIPFDSEPESDGRSWEAAMLAARILAEVANDPALRGMRTKSAMDAVCDSNMLGDPPSLRDGNQSEVCDIVNGAWEIVERALEHGASK